MLKESLLFVRVLVCTSFPFFHSRSTGNFILIECLGRAKRRAIWDSSEPISLASRGSTIRHWLNECKTQHTRCRKTLNPRSLLAARILAVQRDRDGYSVRLVSTHDLDIHHAEYVVLSHVWGGIDIPCKTTTENIERYYTQGIKYSTLPPTFRDAILITFAIGMQYIWIDSLCIVQDDEKDWQRESAHMASIFQAGALTLSATSARNSLEGCSLDSISKPAIQFNRPSKNALDFAIRGPEYAGVRHRLRDEMVMAPVTTRAWIFQEKILSRRMVHATKSQFVWQCATHSESEDGTCYESAGLSPFGPFGVLDSHLLRDQTNGETTEHARHALERRWWNWIRDYSDRDIGRPSDRYAAFAGVVRLLQDITDDEPVVGLWKKNLPLHLAWNAFPEHGERKALFSVPETRFPTWTWMTFPHNSVILHSPNVEWDDLERKVGVLDKGIVYQAETVSVDIQWTGEPLTSTPSGTITMRGIYSRQLRPGPKRQGYRGLLLLDPGLPDSTKEKNHFDTLALVAYLFRSSLRDDPPFITTLYLLVEMQADGRYTRIGTLDICRSVSSLDDSEVMPTGEWKDFILA